MYRVWPSASVRGGGAGWVRPGISLPWYSLRAAILNTGWARMILGRANLYAFGATFFCTLNGPYHLSLNLCEGLSRSSGVSRKSLKTNTSSPSFRASSTRPRSAYNDCRACAATMASCASRSASTRPSSHDSGPFVSMPAPAFCFVNKLEGVTGWHPWLRKNGVLPVDAWSALLIANSHSDRSSSQLFCLWLTKALSVSSMTRFTRSVMPSVGGWLAVLIFSSTPRILKTSLKNADVNRGSRSQTIVLLKPWAANTWSTYNRAASLESTWTVVGIRCTYFVRWSTKVRMALCPQQVGGSAMMKSMLMSVQGCSGTGRDCNSPALVWLPFTRWHRSQDLTKSFTVLLMPGQ